MQITRDGKQRRSQAEWKQIVSEFQESGLSLREFSQQQSIPLVSLQRWNHRLASKSEPSQAEFVDVTPEPAVSETWYAEIELPSGLIFRLRA